MVGDAGLPWGVEQGQVYRSSAWYIGHRMLCLLCWLGATSVRWRQVSWKKELIKTDIQNNLFDVLSFNHKDWTHDSLSFIHEKINFENKKKYSWWENIISGERLIPGSGLLLRNVGGWDVSRAPDSGWEISVTHTTLRLNQLRHNYTQIASNRNKRDYVPHTHNSSHQKLVRWHFFTDTGCTDHQTKLQVTGSSTNDWTLSTLFFTR